jgi:hypothetical protein
MSSHITIITPDGTYKHEPIDKLSLERAQEIVGGYVQVVPMFDKFSVDGEMKPVPCAVLCDEEGKMKGKPINNRATLEWQKCTKGWRDDDLVGTVVVITGPAYRAWR